MNRFILSVAIIALAYLNIGGCATTSQVATNNLPFVKVEAYSICRGVLLLAVSDKDRTDISNDIYTVANVGYTITSGTVPTPEQYQAAILLATPNAKEWSDLASELSGLWALVYPDIKDNPKLALQYLNQISAGAMQATKTP